MDDTTKKDINSSLSDRGTLIDQLNYLHEQLNINPYNDTIKTKIAWVKEKISRLDKKIRILRMRDLHWED